MNLGTVASHYKLQKKKRKDERKMKEHSFSFLILKILAYKAYITNKHVRDACFHQLRGVTEWRDCLISSEEKYLDWYLTQTAAMTKCVPLCTSRHIAYTYTHH